MMRVLVLLCALSLSACAGGGSRPAGVPGAAALAGIPTRGLPPQTLAQGECGLFLWSQTDLSQFVFFSKAASGRGVTLIGAEEVQLVQTKAEGDLFGQFTTEMGYTVEGARDSIELSLTPGELLTGGQRVSSGRMLRVDTEGWQTITPILGVRACRLEP
ncbi:MAG: hypothetical protein AAFX03_13310 [Pseudomonadota bacterium]